MARSTNTPKAADSKLIPITNLQLNPDNPRLEPRDDGSVWSQKALIRHYSLDDTVRELATDISERGINPTKIAIVAVDPEDRTQHLVTEGNRRLAALRLLNDPKLADDTTAAKFFAQLAKSGIVPKALPCIELAKDDANH